MTEPGSIEATHPTEAEALGREMAGAGASAASVVQAVSASHGFAEHAAARAIERAIAGWEDARASRRDDWLRILVHDLKNPLNTVVNGLWLVRARLADKPEIARILELATRAVRRMEDVIQLVRQLDAQVLGGPPPRKLPGPPTPSSATPTPASAIKPPSESDH
jgi:hypothetical protein